MLGSVHRRPSVPTGSIVETLRRPDEKANRLTPLSLVTVINRGRTVIEAKFDGEDFELPPFTHKGGTEETPYLMQIPYGAALLFQRHAPIPGTRDAHSADAFAESFLGILDTDAPEACAPLSVDECTAAGQAIEAIGRLEGESTRVVDMKDNRRRTTGQGGLGNAQNRLQTTTGEENDREADAIARDAMQPPDGVSPEIQSEAAEGEAELANQGESTPRQGRRRR